MAKNVPFGPDVKLPSIEGLASNCEEELYSLMKEIDLAFDRKHKDLHSEVEKLKVSEKTKEKQIEKLESIIKTEMQTKKHNSEQQAKLLLEEIEKLRNENAFLKNSMDTNSRIMHEQLESLRNDLTIKKVENASLSKKVTDLNHDNTILQENYRSVLELLSGKINQPQNGNKMTNFVDTFVTQEEEKYMGDEDQYCQELISKISLEVQQFRDAITTKHSSGSR